MNFRCYPLGNQHTRLKMNWFLCRAVPIEYKKKDAVLINLVDLTKQKEFEQLIQTQDKMASLGHIAAGIAHEIRNPLSGMNIYIGTLEKMYGKSDNLDKIPDILRQLKSASSKIESVIRRVMDFSKPSETKLVEIDINRPVEDALSLSSVMLRKTGIKFDIKLNKELPKCRVDSQMLEQVVLNLINNASDVLRNYEGHKRIEVATGLENEQLIISVSDSGPGVPPEMRDHIFDPFFTSKSEGTGIGLAICRRIISDHNGKIYVISNEWHGAKFKIEIPINSGLNNQ